EWLAGLGGLAERRVVRRHGAPTEKRLALGLHDALKGLLDPAADGLVAREKNQPGAVLPGRRQRDSRLLADFLEKLVWELQQHARAVAGVGLAAGRAAMIEIGQDLQRLLQDRVGLASMQIHHEADAACIMLKPRIVEPLLAGAAGSGRRGGTGAMKGSRGVR